MLCQAVHLSLNVCNVRSNFCASIYPIAGARGVVFGLFVCQCMCGIDIVYSLRAEVFCVRLAVNFWFVVYFKMYCISVYEW